uniref:Peptidase S1 domain-containing protein n=1 Tax=Peronospora matthiolae TaxID=2874970 RepID=A0AAV1V8K3_9STRA
MKGFHLHLFTSVCAVWASQSFAQTDTRDSVNLIEHTDTDDNSITGADAISMQNARNDSLDHPKVPASDVAVTNASNVTTQTFDGKTSVVPIGTKTYVVGLRSKPEGNSTCIASLITPTHLLAGTRCAWSDVRWASIGSHYRNGTQDGEQIRIVAILNNPESSAFTFTKDFAILVLERPSTYPPVAFATSNDPSVEEGEWLVKVGWDDTGGAFGTLAYELMRADVQVISNSACMEQTTIDDSMLCSRSSTSEAACTGHYGGPVIREQPSGDVVVALVSWGPDCGELGYPSYYQRVSSALAWIESIVGRKCIKEP